MLFIACPGTDQRLTPTHYSCPTEREAECGQQGQGPLHCVEEGEDVGYEGKEEGRRRWGAARGCGRGESILLPAGAISIMNFTQWPPIQPRLPVTGWYLWC